MTICVSIRRLTISLLTLVLISLNGLSLALAEPVVPKIIVYPLPTGQTLYIKEDHSQPIVTIDTWVKTGSVNETPSINGVSHFLEHLLFKGTEQYGTGEIDRILESRGAEFNAATSDDFTHYYITTATPYWEEALRLHADMMLNATIGPAELERERKVVQEEINRATDNPDRQVFITLSELLYGNHGYALDTLGPKEVIGRVPREDILAYYHYWYQPENFNTVIVGDVDPEHAKRVVTEVFTKPPFSTPERYQPPVVGTPQPPTQPKAQVLRDPNVNQAYFAIGFLAPSLEKPKDVYGLDMAMMALGQGKSSRLYRALREKQPLATSVSAGNYTQKYAGLLYIAAEMQPKNRQAVKEEILKQLMALRANGITEAELRKAKTQYLNDFIFENETTDGVAQSVGYNVTIGDLDDYLTHVNNVQQVTLDDVQRALDSYITLDRAVMVELLPTSEVPADKDVQAAEKANLALLQQAEVPPVTGTASQESAAVPTVDKRVLSNGLTVISKPRADSATVALKLFVKGGQGVEFVPGTASLLAATMMQGTENRTAEAINQELESKGMALSVSADEDFIEITGTAVAQDLGELFTILQDVVTRPTFEPAQIDKKKEQIRQAIAASRDNPSSIAFENLSLALYPEHPYGNVGRRVEQHLDLIDRQRLLDYYHTYFKPENMVAVAVGRFDPKTLTHYLESLYPACERACPERDQALAAIPAVEPLEEARTVETTKSQLAAVWMAQGWLVPPIENVEDYVSLKVLNSLVGSGMSSRLFVDLREKQGLAYVVGSFYPTREAQSRFVMYIGTDPANTEKVRAGFADEIKRLQDELVPADELAEAKSKLIGGYALAHDTNSAQAYYLGLYETVGTGYAFDKRYPELVNHVTPEDIQRVARKYFSGPSVTSLVRPAAKTDTDRMP